jgi:hypothetical protein
LRAEPTTRRLFWAKSWPAKPLTSPCAIFGSVSSTVMVISPTLSPTNFERLRSLPAAPWMSSMP